MSWPATKSFYNLSWSINFTILLRYVSFPSMSPRLKIVSNLVIFSKFFWSFVRKGNTVRSRWPHFISILHPLFYYDLLTSSRHSVTSDIIFLTEDNNKIPKFISPLYWIKSLNSNKADHAHLIKPSSLLTFIFMSNPPSVLR